MTHRSVEDRLRPYIAHAVNLGLDDPDTVLTPREQALRELAETAIAILRGQHPENEGVVLDAEDKEPHMTQELPTEPGWYLDKNGTVWAVADDGSLSELIEREYYPRDTWNPRAHAPFTRLVPLSVEDRTLITEALNIAQESVDDYADQFSTVDARLDEGKTRADAAKMRALAARIAPDQNGDGE